MEDPFHALGVPRIFAVDLATAEKNHRELARALHPDRYADASPSERRRAISEAVRVNEAWRTVKDPLRRAEALFRLGGIVLGDGREPKSPPSFLAEMMDQREALEEAKASRDLARIRTIAGEIEARRRAVEASLEALFSSSRSPEQLQSELGLLGELRYFRRFLDEIEVAEEALV